MSLQSNYLNGNDRLVKTINPSTLKLNNYFTNNSEPIAQFMVEKIISLTMTDLLANSIINEIPAFCFEEVKKTVDPYIKLNFIFYDHDDLDIPPLKEVIIDNIIKEDNKMQDIFNSNIEKIDKIEDDHSPNSHSSIIKPSAEINIDLNPELNVNSNADAKIELNVDPNTGPNADPNPDLNSDLNANLNVNANIAANLNSIFYDNFFDGLNNWNLPTQPKSVVIDRDASTVIPYEKIPFKENKEEEDVSVLSQKKEKKHYPHSARKEKKIKEPLKKKKGQPPLEIVAYDLPKELIFNVNETEELVEMRLEREREIKEREIEYRKKKQKAEENLEKMNENVKKLKEFELKNITVDANGSIVFIKDLQPELFPIEFKGSLSTTKEVQLIKAEPFILPVLQSIPKRKLNLMIKSPEKDKENIKEKNASKRGFLAKLVPIINQFSPEKKADLKEEKLYREKYSIQPSGSPFDVIKLEVGVALLEDTKYKTGGKDFYKKYKKYSVENFRTTQSKGDDDYDENKSDKKKKDKEEKIKAPEPEVNYVNINTEPSSTGKALHVKAKNFRNTIDKLDLITEEQEKEAMKKNFNRTKPSAMYNRAKPIKFEEINSTEGNIGHNKFNNTQTSFNEMNQFAKTIVGNQTWGSNPLKFKETMQQPKTPSKPQLNDLKRILPGGMINTKMPRARQFAYVNKESNIQPMNNTTTTGFYKVVKDSKYKPERTHGTSFKPKDDPFSRNKDNSPFNKTSTENFNKD